MNARTWTHEGAVFILATILVASPALQAGSFPAVSYALTPDSTYQEGCFDPCMCPIYMEQPMTGSFDLIFYPFEGPLWTVAVENVDWSVPAFDRQITGQGVYTRAGDQQQLQLELQIDGEEPRAFDSGWVDGGDAYPTIDITLTMNDFYCFDIVLRLRAMPVDQTPQLVVGDGQLIWTAIPGAGAYDVACGDLTELHATGGDFHTSVDACLADGIGDTVLPENVTVAPGQVVWYLVRPEDGSYDSGDAAQAGSRDEGIDSSVLSCQ